MYPTQKKSRNFSINWMQCSISNTAREPRRDFPGKNAALCWLNHGACKGEQGRHAPPGIMAAPSCTDVQLCPTDVERDERISADVSQWDGNAGGHFHDPRRRFNRQRVRCEVICTVFNAEFSFYQAALITHRKGITVRLSAELQPLLFFSMTVLLLFLGISCTGPRVGSSSEIPLRWTLNGEWKTTFCCLWIPPNWICFRLRTVVFWVLFFSLPDFIPIADFFYSWM